MYAAIPATTDEPASLVQTLWAVKQNVEILTGAHTRYHLPFVPKTATSIAIGAAISTVKRLNP
jgi:hypothetical protein